MTDVFVQIKVFSEYDPSCAGELDPFEVKHALIEAGKDVSDALVFQMMTSIGKVGHEYVKVNFREFAQMCNKQFFPVADDTDETKDVREAFQILGGGPDGAGQVSVDKLKEFTNSTELTIDIDQFVAEVDDDQSGLVDYDEFCKLFSDRKMDTNLHASGEYWLRHDLGTDPTLPQPTARAKTPTSLVIESASDAGLSPKDDAGGAGHALAAPGTAPSRTHSNAQSPMMESVGRRRSPDADTQLPTAPYAPRVKKVLQATLSSLERARVVPNSTAVTCRRGWRFSQLRKNIPGLEGYNSYMIKAGPWKELGAVVKMRSRGAEFALEQPAACRLDTRLSTQLRLRKITQPPPRTPTPNTPLLVPPSRPPRRPHTRASANPFQYTAANEILVSAGDTSREGVRRVAEGLVVNAEGGGRGFSRGSTLPPPRKIRTSQDPTRRCPWRDNMRHSREALPTRELLARASSVGLYQGQGVRETGPGISFFDDS